MRIAQYLVAGVTILNNLLQRTTQTAAEQVFSIPSCIVTNPINLLLFYVSSVQKAEIRGQWPFILH